MRNFRRIANASFLTVPGLSQHLFLSTLTKSSQFAQKLGRKWMHVSLTDVQSQSGILRGSWSWCGEWTCVYKYPSTLTHSPPLTDVPSSRTEPCESTLFLNALVLLHRQNIEVIRKSRDKIDRQENKSILDMQDTCKVRFFF